MSWKRKGYWPYASKHNNESVPAFCLHMYNESNIIIVSQKEVAKYKQTIGKEL